MVGFVLAVKVLPIIIFVASLMAIGYHLGIMQRIVALLARGLSSRCTSRAPRRSRRWATSSWG